MQSVNIWTGSLAYWVVMILSVLCIAIISACNMFCSPCSLLSILRFFSWVVDAISGFFSGPISGAFFHGGVEGSIRIVAMHRVNFLGVFVLICREGWRVEKVVLF